MIPAPFTYLAPETPAAVLAALTSHESSVLLAGGHSLLTDLKQRRERPTCVIDIAQAGLDHLAISAEGELVVGANVRQLTLAGFCAENGWPLLAEIGEKAGDPMIRARGTFVGALCAAEPGGDWAAAALALDAELVVLTADGEERVSYDEYRNQPRAGAHLVLEARMPASSRSKPQGYVKVKHAAIGWAVASLAYAGIGSDVRLAASGALAAPQRLKGLEARAADHIADAELMDVLTTEFARLPFVGDRYAPANWRRKRLTLLLRDYFQIISKEET